MNNEIKEILDKFKIVIRNDLDYMLRTHNCKILLDYITNLQQAVEVKNERIKEEQQEKERYIKFYNELNIWNKELQQENEDNLKCIKNLKEQLESVIKNNQELLKKWHKNNDKIVNLISENERLKENNSDMQEEMARTWEENERLKQDYINVKNYIKMRNVSTEVEDKALLYNIELENINKKKYLDYKSRCEKAISKINDLYSYADNEEYVDNYCKDLLNILQNGSDSQ